MRQYSCVEVAEDVDRNVLQDEDILSRPTSQKISVGKTQGRCAVSCLRSCPNATNMWSLLENIHEAISTSRRANELAGQGCHSNTCTKHVRCCVMKDKKTQDVNVANSIQAPAANWEVDEDVEA